MVIHVREYESCHSRQTHWCNKKSHQPIFTSIHCLCHCLALAAAQAGNEVTYIANKFKPTLTQLFYFYENRVVRTSGLKAIQELLDITKLKLNQPANTHWLSHDGVCRTFIKILLFSLVWAERQKKGECISTRIAQILHQYKFIATLYMMGDVLPIVTQLGRILQNASVYPSQLHQLVKSTVLSLEQLRHDSTGTQLKRPWCWPCRLTLFFRYTCKRGTKNISRINISTFY